MTLAVAMILFGALLVYAGLKGKSITGLLSLRGAPASTKPATVDRGT
jgi:hypothetical protein